MAHKATRASNSSVFSLGSLASSTPSSALAVTQPGTHAAVQPNITQTIPAALAPTPFPACAPLLTTNALTALSQLAGNLDYPAYVQYLTQIGHLRNPWNPQGFMIPAQPLNSSLLQHDRGDRNDNLTDYRPEQAHWSQENLPEMIYTFDKPANWLGRADLKDPPLKTYPIYGKFLRDIPILPDHISKDVEGWRMETWSRFDPRIRKHDLVNRMPPAARSDHNTDLSMRAQRFRKVANVLGWVAKGGKFASEKQRLQQLLQEAGVPLSLNTTRGISWGENPYGQPIPVPAKLRWASCVEAAPTQAPLAPAVPAVVNTLLAPPLAAIGLAPDKTTIPAAIAPALAPPPTPEQLLSASTPNSQPTRLSLAGAHSATRHTISSDKDAAGTSFTNMGSATNSFKRNRENDDHLSNPTYMGENSQRLDKKPRRFTLTGAAVNDGPRGGSFRKRWPRAAFKGAGEDMTQSLNEWIQETNVSHVASEAGLVNSMPIQPARPSLGYHGPYIYYREGNGSVVAAPEDFLHCNGVDAGRVARLGVFQQVTNGVDVGAYVPVVEAEVLSSEYPQVGDYAHPDAMPDAQPVAFTVRSVVWYLGQLDEGESSILS